MSKMMYVLVSNPASSSFRLIYGQFDETPKVGDVVKRDLSTGGSTWFIAKVYDDDQQRKLQAVSTLTGFDELQKIVSFDC